MPKQTGPIRIDGKVGNLSFFTDAEGNNRVRRKGGPSANRVKTDPQYARFRQHISEFGLAAERSSAINDGFRGALSYVSDAGYFSRLTGLVKAIQLTDQTAPKGHRDPINGNMYLLEGFQYNKNALLDDILKVDYTTYIDPSTGTVHSQFASFSPKAAIEAPGGATHFQLLARGTALDPSVANTHCYETGTAPLPFHSKETGFIELSLNIPVGTQALLLFGLGCMFYREEMGAFTPLRGGSFSITRVERIIHADGAASVATEMDLAKRSEAMQSMLNTIVYRQPKKPRKKDPGYSLYLPPEQEALQTEKQRKLDQVRWLRSVDKHRKGS
jgi:hypothetical protein